MKWILGIEGIEWLYVCPLYVQRNVNSLPFKRLDRNIDFYQLDSAHYVDCTFWLYIQALLKFLGGRL